MSAHRHSRRFVCADRGGGKDRSADRMSVLRKVPECKQAERATNAD
jgi:hypothetical protein